MLNQLPGEVIEHAFNIFMFKTSTVLMFVPPQLRSVFITGIFIECVLLVLLVLCYCTKITVCVAELNAKRKRQISFLLLILKRKSHAFLLHVFLLNLDGMSVYSELL